MKVCPKCQRDYPNEQRFCLQDGVLLVLKDPYGLVGRVMAEKYRIDALVGVGGMGAVYSAHHLRIDRKVAFKMLLPHLALSNAQVISLFEREARMAGQLQHENIAAVYDAGRTPDDITYLIMEWLDGPTLADALASKGKLSLERTANLLRQIAAALDAAHAKHIIHRDLKPANVMLVKGPNGQPQVKVLDFGLAKVVSETTDAPVSALMGTPHYASPEQFRLGARIDGRTDIYSLGVMLYEMLAGTLPFNAPTIHKLMRLQQAATPPPLRQLRPDVPVAIEQLVSQMMAKDPQQRPARAGEAAQLFENALRSPQAIPAETNKKPSNSAPTVIEERTAHATPIQAAAASAAPTVMPRKTSLQTRVQKLDGHKLVGIVIVVLALAVAVGFYLYRNRQIVLTDKDTILVTDFVNTTGDTVFDGTLKQGLAVQLEQSPFFTLFPEEGVSETLRYMGRTPEERVTKEIGREICQRRGLKALLAGSIASLGNNYVISLEAIDGQTGATIARAQIEAEGKERVLSALNEVSTKLRGKLGESLPSLQKYDVQIEQATTSSLEALKAFSQGVALLTQGKNREAIPFYKRAIELDPNFAMSHVWLGYAYGNTGQRKLLVAEAVKAYELRERVTEREKYFITAGYYQFVTGEREKALEAYELWKQAYPRYWGVRNQLRNSLAQVGQDEKSLEEAREAYRLNPDIFLTTNGLYFHLLRHNRFDEAEEVCKQALAKGINPLLFRQSLYRLALIRNDKVLLQQQLDWANSQTDKNIVSSWQAGTREFHGQMKKSREISSANRLGWTAAITGDCQQALKFVTLPTDSYLTGIALAMCGEAGKAQLVIDEIAKEYPKDTIYQYIWIPIIKAEIELQRGSPDKALDLLKVTNTYERAGRFDLASLKGRIYLCKKASAESTAEFQKILDHRGWAPFDPLYPLAYLGLARAAAINGDAAKTRQSYEAFFALWKDADADLPILLAAKQEYAKLK